MRFNKISYILPLFLLFSACVANMPDIEDFPNEKISFEYSVNGDYKLDYLVGSDIQFVNNSEVAGNASWNFGDNTPEVTGNNPVHKYQKAGTYIVRLTIEGQGYVDKKIMISDIFPTITLSPLAGGVCEVKSTVVQFNVEIPNPQGLPVEYKWIFPAGTTTANGTPITESTSANPGGVKFMSVGSQKVRLQSKLGDRWLEESYINVQVGYSQPVKTLYFAVKGGNLMALKLISNLPADIKNSAFDLGVKSGQHPFNILFNDTSVYVLDAGRQFNYVNDVDGNLGDGRIMVISRDGSIVETMLTNIGGTAFNDPFYGHIEPAEKTLYFSDRNTGISKISLDKRNETLTRDKFPYWVQNATLGYYNNGYQFGSITSGFSKVNGVWWWGKSYAGVGIFRFRDTDILSTAVTTPIANPTSGRLIPDIYVKSFVVDVPRQTVYFTVRDDAYAGFYKVSLADAETIKTFDDLKVPGRLIQSLVPDTEGSSGEFVYITQLALDPEDGSVYFGYRTGDATKVISGLKRYNPATNKVEGVLDNIEIYGVTINNTKSKLF